MNTLPVSQISLYTIQTKLDQFLQFVQDLVTILTTEDKPGLPSDKLSTTLTLLYSDLVQEAYIYFQQLQYLENSSPSTAELGSPFHLFQPEPSFTLDIRAEHDEELHAIRDLLGCHPIPAVSQSPSRQVFARFIAELLGISQLSYSVHDTNHAYGSDSPILFPPTSQIYSSLSQILASLNHVQQLEEKGVQLQQMMSQFINQTRISPCQAPDIL